MDKVPIDIKIYCPKTKFKARVCNVKDYEEVIEGIIGEDEVKSLKVSVKIDRGYGRNHETGLTSVVNITGTRFVMKRLVNDILIGWGRRHGRLDV